MVLRYSWTRAWSFATQHLTAKGIGVEDELCGCGAPARIEAQIAEGPQQQLVVKWRKQFTVSLRKPNKRWKVPRRVLLQRLRIMWLNLVRVRTLCLLVHRYDPEASSSDSPLCQHPLLCRVFRSWRIHPYPQPLLPRHSLWPIAPWLSTFPAANSPCCIDLMEFFLVDEMMVVIQREIAGGYIFHARSGTSTRSPST